MNYKLIFWALAPLCAIMAGVIDFKIFGANAFFLFAPPFTMLNGYLWITFYIKNDVA